jgi:hypothetical protein
VLVDLVAPSGAVRNRFDHLHRLIDPSHVRAFLEDELADLRAGSMDWPTRTRRPPGSRSTLPSRHNLNGPKYSERSKRKPEARASLRASIRSTRKAGWSYPS